MDSIIEKIQKLRALAASANLNEAAVAAAAAERLIQQHCIEEAEIASHGKEDETVENTVMASFPKNIVSWQSILINTLANAYQCKAVVSGTRILAYGRPADIATLKYQHAFFSLEITRLALIHGNGRGKSYANSFRMGAVTAIARSLTDVSKEVRTTAESSALAVVDARAIRAEEAVRKAHKGLHARNANYRVDSEGYRDGQRAGADINQRSQIGGSGTRLLK